MRNRSLGALLLIASLVLLNGCVSDPSLTSIIVTPGVMNFGGPGLTTQLTAIGHYSRPNHADVTKDITNLVTWKSATPDCVTVSNTGLITSGRNICSGIPISASMQGFHGIIIGSMTVNVTQAAAASTDVAQVVISPAFPAPLSAGALLQFSAFGLNSAGSIAQLVNPVVWSSSNTGVATIDQGGRVTAVTAGTSTITGAYTNADGIAAISGTATVTVQ
ncbi:MAG TPA: Ig-like domain-containing protein [Terracidiphilus sp.]|nr:Ig-like domain-containing protein [Terracidiphilus sp.]